METTQGTAAPDVLREHLHQMWSSVAESWGEYADYIDTRAVEMTGTILTSIAPRPGDRVLELACGAGGLGLAIAPLVAPVGTVLLSDVSEEMVTIAAARAKEKGITNVSARALGIESIDEPDDSFDVVVCREGLMFALDHALAAREIVRVTAPGGRIAIAVWGPKERNPWLNTVFEIASAHLGMPVPPPGIPGPFALDDPDTLRELLADAGVEDIRISEVSVPTRDATFEQWWTRTSSLSGPLAKILENLPAESQAALLARAREAVRPFEAAGGLEFPGVSLVATGRRSASTR